MITFEQLCDRLSPTFFDVMRFMCRDGYDGPFVGAPDCDEVASNLLDGTLMSMFEDYDCSGELVCQSIAKFTPEEVMTDANKAWDLATAALEYCNRYAAAYYRSVAPLRSVYYSDIIEYIKRAVYYLEDLGVTVGASSPDDIFLKFSERCDTILDAMKGDDTAARTFVSMMLAAKW